MQSSQSGGRQRVVWGSGTPRTLRAHWMLAELGLEYDHRAIGSRSGETQTPGFVALNPSRKIPVLQDGDLTLSESAAIVNYLAAAYGGEAFALPADPAQRARYDQWCFFSMMELDANTLYIIRRHEDLKDVYGDAPHACEAARLCFSQQAQAAAERLARAGGEYAMGPSFSAADVLLTTSLTGARRRDIALPAPLDAYLARTTARAAYKRALEKNQPPARSAA